MPLLLGLYKGSKLELSTLSMAMASLFVMCLTSSDGPCATITISFSGYVFLAKAETSSTVMVGIRFGKIVIVIEIYDRFSIKEVRLHFTDIIFGGSFVFCLC